MLCHDPLYQSEAKANAAVLLAGAIIQPHKGFKHALSLGLRYSAAIIIDIDRDRRIGQLRTDRYFALGMSAGVAQQVSYGAMKNESVGNHNDLGHAKLATEAKVD
jgi:hypothetical protein